MTESVREKSTIGLLLLLATFVFTLGITWGLPSRKSDAFLFGDRTPWTGAQILALAPARSSMAADVDANPAVRGSIVNDTDAKRSEIVRRYRLFTYQPDEMITMMSLAQMHPASGDFDPRLYQYGGLWIYPVGALIKLLLHPVADPAYYLDHPEQFAKFYVVARGYSAAWGVVGAWAVYRLIRGGASRSAAILATLLYITMPVVVNMAHEAKPHLPGATLMLLAAVAARRYVRRGGWGNLIGMSALCGAAGGMILSDTIAVVIVIVAVVLRPLAPSTREKLPGLSPGLAGFKTTEPSPRLRGKGGRALACGVALVFAIAIYFLTNPYVLKHLLTDRSVLSANLANSQAMYHFDPIGGAVRAVQLVAEGAGLFTVAGAIVGAGSLTRTQYRPKTDRPDEVDGALPALAPLIACSAVVAFQFAALAAGKPGEYARFALIVDVTLALIAAGALDRASISKKMRNAGIALLLLGTTLPGSIYIYDFCSDSFRDARRVRLAETLQQLRSRGLTTLAVPDEPAPYLLPPVDLWHWQIELMPRSQALANTSAQVVVGPEDAARVDPIARKEFKTSSPIEFADIWPARISWANKWIQIWRREP